MGHRLGETAAVKLRHAQAIIEEGELELAGLQHAGNVGVVVGRGEVIPRVGMAPGAREVRAVLRLQKADQYDVAHPLPPDACE